MDKGKIVSFTDLIAWQEGHKLVLMIYDLTKSFPNEELFGLISQMKRAAVSITSNIAEGFGRRTAKDKIQFYKISIGSLLEIQNQLIISRDLKCINSDTFQKALDLSITVNKIACGLINKLQTADS